MCVVTASKLVAPNVIFDHDAAEQTLIASLVMLVWTGRPPSLMRTSTL